MKEKFKNKEAITILLTTLEENPELWETRKKTAKLLYAEKYFEEAADIIWKAPNIPSVDTDVAFIIQMMAKAKPNRAIRLILEVLKRNKGKAAKNIAMANALNKIGLYLVASRFYGVAVAEDASLYNAEFESQMLWVDDSNKVMEGWKKSKQIGEQSLNVDNVGFEGDAISPKTSSEHEPTVNNNQLAGRRGKLPLASELAPLENDQNKKAVGEVSRINGAPQQQDARSIENMAKDLAKASGYEESAIKKAVPVSQSPESPQPEQPAKSSEAPQLAVVSKQQKEIPVNPLLKQAATQSSPSKFNFPKA